MYLHREGRVILISLALVLIALMSALHAWLGSGGFFYTALVLAIGVFVLFAQFFRIPRREAQNWRKQCYLPFRWKSSGY